MKTPIFTFEQRLVKNRTKLAIAALKCKREIQRGFENSILGGLIKRLADWLEKMLNK
jgi:hypothetical protein